MSNSPNFAVRQYRAKLLALTTLVVLTGASVASAIQLQNGNQGTGESVFIPAPREITRPIALARQAIEDGDFVQSVRLIGFVLGDVSSEDYLVAVKDNLGTYNSIIGEAQKVLGSMSSKGLEHFEIRYGFEAKKLLEEAVESGDIESLAGVTRRYFHTEAGYQATMLLGNYHLDQGKPLAAARLFDRIVSTPSDSKKI